MLIRSSVCSLSQSFLCSSIRLLVRASCGYLFANSEFGAIISATKRNPHEQRFQQHQQSKATATDANECSTSSSSKQCNSFSTTEASLKEFLEHVRKAAPFKKESGICYIAMQSNGPFVRV